MFEVVDGNVAENDWVRSKSSTRGVIVRVGVRWDKELGGFSFKEVLVNAEESGVDEEEEVPAGEIILVVSDDGLCRGGGIGFVSEVGGSISSFKRGRHDGRRRERKMGRQTKRSMILNRRERVRVKEARRGGGLASCRCESGSRFSILC